MHWTLQVAVFLLNVGLIAFWFHLDPLSVFVQKRSSPDQEIHFSEFCIAPPSVQKSIHSSADTTSQFNKTATLSSTQQPAIPTRPEMSLTASEPAMTQQEPPTRSSAADSAVTGPPHAGMNPTCCLTYSSAVLNVSAVEGFVHQPMSELCAIETVIFFTTDGEEVCTDPRAPWVLDYIIGLYNNLLVTAQKETESGGSGLLQHDQLQEVSQTEKMNLYQATPPGPGTDIKDQDISSSPNLEASEFMTAGDTITQSRVHQRRRPFGASCCIAYSKVRIPRRYFQDFIVQSTEECGIKAIILRTRHHRMICVDPNDRWFQIIMKQHQSKMTPIAT